MKKGILARIALLSFTLISINALAQFEQQLTINGSAAFVYPDMVEEYSSFGNGFGLEGGLQYNKNRHLSFTGSARFYYLFGSATYADSYYDNIAFGAGLKFNLLPSKKINPFLFAEVNLNLIWFEEYIYTSGTFDTDFGTSFGGLGGAGFDFILSDNFALFIQSGAYYTYWDDRINLYTQGGVRINLIKSKTL